MVAVWIGVAALAAASPRAEAMRRREADWRVGPVVYQVLVDRFAPSSRLEAKRSLYGPPRRLRAWSDLPEPGSPVPELGVWSHELDFWGGDLQSLIGKLDHVRSLADVLYLNPIHDALTNHKYDATDWRRISPEYGDWADFRSLARAVHASGVRLVLDGVFNHCGRSNPIFQEALANPASKRRSWFFFDDRYPAGYRAWAGVANLPEVRLESADARRYLWNGSDSVVARYLKAGADGWRLDVAHELGPGFLAEPTRAAHRHKSGSLVLGEVWNYPAGWTSVLDGLLNMFLGRVILELADGRLSPRQVGEALNELVRDCGIEPLLRSWIVLGNHDTPRLATVLPDRAKRRFAQALQFALPGAPLIYYGDELGMRGGDDPRQRAPMRWDLATEDNPDLQWVKRLVAVRRGLRALRIGDFRAMRGERALAFLRTTERPLEAVVVVANPSEASVDETWIVPDGTLMGYTLLRDALSGATARVLAGTLRATIPPRTVRVFAIDPEARDRGQYKRMPEG